MIKSDTRYQNVFVIAPIWVQWWVQLAQVVRCKNVSTHKNEPVVYESDTHFISIPLASLWINV